MPYGKSRLLCNRVIAHNVVIAEFKVVISVEGQYL